MQGHLMMLGERFFAPRYFGLRFFGIAIPARHQVEVPPALRIALVDAAPEAPAGSSANRIVRVPAAIRTVVVPPAIRQVVAEDSERVASSA